MNVEEIFVQAAKLLYKDYLDYHNNDNKKKKKKENTTTLITKSEMIENNNKKKKKKLCFIRIQIRYRKRERLKKDRRSS